MTSVDKITKQVGGDHYRSEYQHWDFIEGNGIGYLEAAATKYITRWRAKNGREDLDKALSYVDKLIELHRTIHRLPRGIASMSEVTDFVERNNLDSTEARAIMYLSRWANTDDLRSARSAICYLISEARREEEDEERSGKKLKNLLGGEGHPFGFDKEQDTEPL